MRRRKMSSVKRRRIWVPTVAFSMDLGASTLQTYDQEPTEIMSVNALGGTLSDFESSNVSALAQRDFEYTVERVVGRCVLMYAPLPGTDQTYPERETWVKLAFAVVPTKESATTATAEIDLWNMWNTNIGKRMGRLPWQRNWSISEYGAALAAGAPSEVGPQLSLVQSATEPYFQGPVSPEFDFKPNIRVRQNQSVQWLGGCLRPSTASGGIGSQPALLELRVYPRILIAHDE